MQRRSTLLPIVGILLGVSFLFFLVSQTSWFKSMTGVVELVTVPVQEATYTLFRGESQVNDVGIVQKENIHLRTQLAQQKQMEKELKALRDQFATSNPLPKKLLPARVIGMTTFMPGVAPASEIVIDKGSSDGVKVDAVLVSRDNLVGKIVKTSAHTSVVRLITHKDISFTVNTLKTSVPGVMKGTGGERLLLDNVVLSDKLEKDDMVVTKGDMSADGVGFPPDLVVGKIISVSKKKSALFQTAEVQSLINFSRLELIFVMVN